MIIIPSKRKDFGNKIAQSEQFKKENYKARQFYSEI